MEICHKEPRQLEPWEFLLVSRTRKSVDERLAEVVEQQQRLEARRQVLLAAKRAGDRKLDRRRKILVGSAVLAQAKIDPIFAKALRVVLAEAVTSDTDRAAISDLVPSPARTDAAA